MQELGVVLGNVNTNYSVAACTAFSPPDFRRDSPWSRASSPFSSRTIYGQGRSPVMLAQWLGSTNSGKTQRLCCIVFRQTAAYVN